MDIDDAERRLQFRKLYIKHLETIQMMPADQVNSYLEERENNAAAKIQAFWKGYQFRKQLKSTECDIKKNKAATVIQREVRKWLAKRNEINNTKEYEYFQVLNGKKIDELYSKVEKWKEKFSDIKPCSQEELRKQYLKAQEMLETFYLNRSKRLERIHHIDTLITKLDADVVLSKNLPSLEEVTKEDATMFYVCSQIVISKAKLAHEQEMKKLIYPWRRELAIINKNEWTDLFPELISSNFP